MTNILRELRQKLRGNRKKYQRDFLWRHNPDPYKIMVAEFMLQRTKAEQVEPVYKKFLRKYPDVFKLASARNNSVSKFTTHLGLHKRSQNFINAAKYIVKQHQGNYPEKREELTKIPGVGDYVAGAILTVYYNKPEHVVDSNIARFINRYWGLKLAGEIRRKKPVIEKARELFNDKNTGDLLFNLLDFTTLICKPKKPECKSCILKRECKYLKIK